MSAASGRGCRPVGVSRTYHAFHVGLAREMLQLAVDFVPSAPTRHLSGRRGNQPARVGRVLTGARPAVVPPGDRGGGGGGGGGRVERDAVHQHSEFVTPSVRHGNYSEHGAYSMYVLSARACARACVRACVRACMCMCMCVCVCVRVFNVCWCGRVRTRAYICKRAIAFL